ncbi:MAG: efflux RND transporter permease subunit [Sediminibacterium sp.]|nr:efflux RND transporter permease subunit [Sediminibacterium sp.]
MTLKFTERPVLSIVISIFILLLGIIALTQLPITQFPNIAPPEVTVTTKYTGANAETCVKAVVTPLERAINGVPGMSYMSSVSGNDGTSVINIVFKSGTDPELAAVNVQNRVSSALDELPQEAVKAGVIVEKVQNSMLLYLNLLSNDSSIDEKFLYNFTDINILPELKRIEGVGFADIMGMREYSMRIWLNPVKMHAYNVSSQDIINSLKEQNIEAAPGKVGDASGKRPQSLQYVLKYIGKFNTEEQYQNIIIKSTSDGALLKLKDVAEIELGSQEYDVISKENGKPSAAVLLKQRPGTNANEVINNIKKRMEELKKNFNADIDYTISYDVSNFLNASIKVVLKTLLEAFLLVSLVVFIFLQDWRSTLIPALTVPVSLIGTFMFMQFFGFSLNLITLFALVLAIGIVVDNAIVVVEAVHFKMEKLHMTPAVATDEAMKEISRAIIGITLVMSAVFIPVSFIPGPTGIFYREFSLTMAVAIVLSGIIALTLTPALCVLLLKPHNSASSSNNWLTKFLKGFNNGYDKVENKFQWIIEVISNKRVVIYGSLIALSLITGVLGKILPNGFIPNEDQGTIYANITSPSGATLERTEKVVDAIQLVANELDMVSSVSTLAGFNVLTDGTGANFGMNLISLKNWDKRKYNDQEIIEILKDKTKNIQDAKIEFFTPPPIPGYGNASGFELRLLDKTGKGDLKAFEKVTNDFVAELNKDAALRNTYTSFDASFPQYMVNIDYTKAAQKNVIVDDILNSLQTFLGSEYATNFIRFGQLYRVMVQAAPEFRAHPEDILKLNVKNRNGEMVSMSSFLTIEKIYGPEQVTRYNMYPSAIINGEPEKKFSSGQAIDAIKATAIAKLPKGYDYDWAGSSKDQAEQGNESIFIFVICSLFIYLLLSAQYESFLLPMPVILSLPAGTVGAFLFLYLFGLENNIYAQIAIIMLIGLLGKNAILIVEFATLKQSEGKTPLEAAIEAARVRLRPILMTSFAFIAGLIPLLFASGAGAIGNKTIGATATGGMLLGTVMGVLVIPGLYVIFATLDAKKSKKKKEIAITETI